jgi:glucan biosynthesis protein C
MMLLGLVLHAGASYTVVELPGAWPYHDRRTHPAFDLTIFFIHVFRMPAFFVMAGFFAALLYERDGAGGFLRNRGRRVAVPLAAAWLVLCPVLKAGVVFANTGGGWTGLAAARDAVVASPYAPPVLGHLWFLYYLLFFYAVACALVPIVGRAMSEGARERWLGWWAEAIPGWKGTVMLAGISMLTLLPMRLATIDLSMTFVPDPRVLAAYGVFFGAGWLLFARRDRVAAFGRRPWRQVGAGVLACAVYLVLIVGLQRRGGIAPGLRVLAAGAGGLATWLLIGGVIGIFVRYADRPRPVQRYLSDAAYWMYLTHLPFTLWVPGLLSRLDWPGPAKFAIVLSSAAIGTLLTYHWLVRSTVIGEWLNGRRLPSGLQRRDAL